MPSPESEPCVDPDTITAKSGHAAYPTGPTHTTDPTPAAPSSLTNLAFGCTGSNFVSDLAPTGTPSPGSGGLADYQIVRELGKGGMGVGYEVRELATGRAVALKKIHADGELGMAEVIRFLAEAKADRY